MSLGRTIGVKCQIDYADRVIEEETLLVSYSPSVLLDCGWSGIFFTKVKISDTEKTSR